MASEKEGWRCGWKRKVRHLPFFLRNQPIVWSSHPAGSIYERQLSSPLLHTSFHDALCMDVFATGVLAVRIEMIVTDWAITTLAIHDVHGGPPAYANRWVMDFRRWPGPDEPNAQLFEDIPDDRWILDFFFCSGVF